MIRIICLALGMILAISARIKRTGNEVEGNSGGRFSKLFGEIMKSAGLSAHECFVVESETIQCVSQENEVIRLGTRLEGGKYYIEKITAPRIFLNKMDQILSIADEFERKSTNGRLIIFQSIQSKMELVINESNGEAAILNDSTGLFSFFPDESGGDVEHKNVDVQENRFSLLLKEMMEAAGLTAERCHVTDIKSIACVSKEKDSILLEVGYIGYIEKPGTAYFVNKIVAPEKFVRKIQAALTDMENYENIDAKTFKYKSDDSPVRLVFHMNARTESSVQIYLDASGLYAFYTEDVEN